MLVLFYSVGELNAHCSAFKGFVSTGAVQIFKAWGLLNKLKHY